MAGTIKGMTIEIGGNTAPLEKALKDTNKEISTTQRELNEINKLLKFDPKNTELLRQKQQLLGDQIKNTTTKLDALKQAQAKLDEEIKKGGNVNQAEYRKLEREIATTENTLKGLKEQAKQTHPEIEKIAQGLKKAGEIAANVAKVGFQATVVGVTALAGACTTAVTAITKLAISAGQMADDLNTMATVTGLSTKQLQEFAYASDLIDVSVDTLAGSLKKLTSNMSNAKKGSGDVYDTFKALGVEFQNSDGTLRNSTEVFNETIKALGNVANETERDALAMKLFGKSATELNPLIEGGIDTLSRMADEANELGLILSQDALDGANAFNDQLDMLKSKGKGLFNVIGTEIATEFTPAMEQVNSRVNEVIKSLTTALKNGGFKGFTEEVTKQLGSLVTDLAKKLPDVVKFGVDIIATLVNSLKENASQIGEGVAEVITTLIDGLYEILPQIVELAITFINSFGKSLGENLPTILPTIVKGILAIADAIVSNLDLIIEAGVTIIEGLIKGILNALPELIKKVPEIIVKVVQALTEAIPMLLEALGEIWQAEIDFFLDPNNLEMLVDTAITFIQTLSNSLLDSLPIIIDAVVKLVDTMCDKLSDTEQLDKFINTAIELMITLANAFIDNSGLLLEKAPEIISSLVSAFARLAPRLFETAITLLTHLGQGLIDNLGELTQPIQNTWEWIKDTMETAFSKVVNVGANLVYGIWDGIRNTKDWLIRKIRQFCSDTLQAIKDFFGIESPSKVMANEVGTYMAEGIGVGFAKEMPSVIKDMESKLSAVTGAMQTELSFGDIPQIQGNTIMTENQYITRNYTNTLETIRQPQSVELVIDDTTIARTLIPALDQEYNRLGVKPA